MTNDYPQEIQVRTYLEPDEDSISTKNLKEVVNDTLMSASREYEPLFSTEIRKDQPGAEQEAQNRYERFSVYSKGVVAQRDDTTRAFYFARRGEDMTHYWADGLKQGWAPTFTGEQAPPDEASSEGSGYTEMVYNYWATNLARWQDSIDGIEAPQIVYKTHKAVGKTLELPMGKTADSLDEIRQLEVNTTVAEDIPADDIQDIYSVTP